jgi:hypothetical protein
MKPRDYPESWTAWHLLAFWAIWFAIASGVSWIIIGAAVWRTLAAHQPPSPILVAGYLSRSSTVILAVFWSIPIIVAARWSYLRITRLWHIKRTHG